MPAFQNNASRGKRKHLSLKYNKSNTGYTIFSAIFSFGSLFFKNDNLIDDLKTNVYKIKIK
jgi:hypothetical protein